MHYLYRHIRLDKNEVFYVGIGTVYYENARTKETYYSRAYRKTKRGHFWNYIVNKAAYEVEILFESEDRKLIEDKEKEFISLYGRRDLNSGTLVNLTDGGEGLVGVKRKELSKKQRERRSGSNHHLFGKRRSEAVIEKIKLTLKSRELPEDWGEKYKGSKNPSAKPVIHILTNKTFGSLKEGCDYFKLQYSTENKRVIRNSKNKNFYYKENTLTTK